MLRCCVVVLLCKDTFIGPGTARGPEWSRAYRDGLIDRQLDERTAQCERAVAIRVSVKNERKDKLGLSMVKHAVG